MNPSLSMKFALAFAFLAAIFAYSAPALAADPVISAITRYCAGCHQQIPGQKNSWTRISQQRKSPEGWAMTIARMQQLGRIQITREESRLLVKELADSFGLTPDESGRYRYALEQRPNWVEHFSDEAFVTHCARCHTGARVALQRRTEAEWRLLGHFHIGQFPSVEMSGTGRAYDIFSLFTDELPRQLAKDYPFDVNAWDSWLASAKPDFTGFWRLTGNQPGKGDFSGIMEATATTKDRFSLSFSGAYSSGEALQGDGTAVVYSGYEWRGSLVLNNQAFKQVFASGAEHGEMTGRMYLTHHVETGMLLRARKMDGSPAVMAISPNYIKAGTKADISIIGTSLSGKVNLGKGVKIKRTISTDNNKIVVQVQAGKRAKEGYRTIRVGEVQLANNFKVYRNIATIKVVPDYAIARVGDNGGTIPKVTAAFQALAFTAGEDGKANTDDDINIGYLPAEWTVKPFDEQAIHDEDVKYAGVMGKTTGIFTPGPAGPNPDRAFNTNNAGNLGVVAIVADGENKLKAEGHLIVTVQRWLNPAIQ